ncbi:MAG: helix-turn-helix transcriptional regulator [Eggerthellaceae bacterium]|nr:helix-turn-helix transcriptional regulator [Eggerthellaceae bacterium]
MAENTEAGTSDLSTQQNGGRTPMGLDGLLDACLGFILSVVSVVLTYVVVVRMQSSLAQEAAYAVCMALIVAGALALGGLFSERLQTKKGQRLLFAVYVVCAVLEIPLCYVQLFALAIPSAAMCLVAAGFIYSDFLNKLPRQSLMTSVDLLVVCVGLFMLVLINLENLTLLIVHVATVVAGVGLTTAFVMRGSSMPEFISDEDSKARHIPLRGNRRSLFAIGFMFSSIELGFWADANVETQVIWIILGSVIAAAGLFSLLARGLDEKNYKDILLKGMSASAVILLLPVTFVSGVFKLVFLFAFVFVATLEVIVVMNAVIESARFNMISPIWLYGREASIFFFGVGSGAALFALGGVLVPTYEFALTASICIACMVLALLQIKVNYQCYPFESALEMEKADEEITSAQEQAGRYKALWQRKVQTACDRYKLSPREREVLHYLVKGRDTKYIMDTFYISQSTAKTHIYNIYRKFDVHSRQDLLDFIEEIEVDSEIDE